MARCAMLLVAAVASAMLAYPTAQAAGLREGGPSAASEIVPLGKVIADAAGPVRIIYVHGMRADGSGSSQAFREELCRQLPNLCRNGQQPARRRIRLQLTPAPTDPYGDGVWTGSDAWDSSQPFVDRYVFSRESGPLVVVDEVNWWPLVFPFKCRFIIAPEAENLAGADRQRLKLCSTDNRGHPDIDPYYPWISEQQAQALIAGRPRSGGAPYLNRKLKLEILDWGLTDAAIALGPMRFYLTQAMDKAFAVAEDPSDAEGGDYVVISESLGSFIVMDAFASPDERPALRRVLERTSDLYFFANQFALLDLARLKGIPVFPEVARKDLGAARARSSSLLQEWAAPPAGAEERRGLLPLRRQIVSFSDPGDVLTYYVPPLQPAVGGRLAVLNLYNKNAFNFLGIFSDPMKAHMGYSRNKGVLDWMLRTK